MSWAMGRSISLLHSLDGACGRSSCVSQSIEGDVLGRHFDEPRAGFDEPPGEQAAEAEAAGVVLVVALLRLRATGRTPRFSGELSRRWAFSIARIIDSC